MLWRTYDNHQVDLPRIRQWIGVATVIGWWLAVIVVVHLVARVWP